MKILLEGTSSSGKSSIVKLFPKDFTKVAMDDILDEKVNTRIKKLKNKYYSKEEKDHFIKVRHEVFDLVINSKNKTPNKLKNIILDSK